MENNPSASILRTEKLAKTFGALVAVNELNLEVMRGDIFGFLGPNGSGKTTTIRMILGLMRPTRGSVQVFGMDVAARRAAILSRLGAIIEWPVFYPYLSGIDNLRVFAAAAGMQQGKANDRRIAEILDVIDLRSAAERPYRTYSLGMKQRLGLGSALLTDPELILLDEPTNGLDPEGVHAMRQLILRLAAQGKTIFLSSHLLYEIQQVCNRVAIMRKGVLLKQGNVRELLRQDSQLLVRLNSAEETQRASALLQQASQQHNMNWISQVSIENNEQETPLLRVDAPVSHSSQISAFLAQQGLYVSLLQPYQASLEDFYLELTETSNADNLSNLHSNVKDQYLLQS